tara:strand:- start:444 stop:2150 length:1707 start_codon:yes stop_codon:yes gene_type:complete
MQILIPFNPIIVQVNSASTINTEYRLNNYITSTASTASVYASENPIIYSFASSAITSTEIGAEVWFNVTTASADDAYFILSGNTEGDYPTYQLTAKSVPGLNEYYSSGTLPAKTTSEIADSIAFALNANISFRQRFYANTENNRVYVQALRSGSRYDLNFLSSDGNLALAVTIYSLDTSRGETLRDYAIWSDLYINSTGTLGDTLNRSGSTIVSSYENTYNSDNSYNVDVSSVIKNYIHTPLPNFTATTFTYANEALVNFYLVAGEQYDEFDSNYRRKFKNLQTEIKWALNSSLGLLEQNNLSAYTYDGTNTAINYLTNSPDTKYSYLDQKENRAFLYSLANLYSAVTDVTFVAQGGAFGLDGSLISATTQIYLSGVTSGGCISFEYGAEQAGISAIESSSGMNVMYYIYEVVANVTTPGGTLQFPIVPSKRIYLIRDCQENPVQMIFRNNLGWWDSFIFNGEVEQTTDRKITTFESVVENPGHEEKSINISNIEIDLIYKAYSEWINKEHFDWLFECLKSTEVRVYENDELRPIIISKVDWKSNTTNDLFTINIEYTYGVRENYITN